MLKNRRDDPLVRTSRRSAIFLAFVAVAWLGVAVWAVTRGAVVEAVAHVLVAILALLAAFLVGDSYRSQATQLRIVLGAAVLVVGTVATFIVSIVL